MPTLRKRKPKSKRSQSTKTVLLDLPLDILLVILTQLDHTDRLTLSLVSKSFKSLIDANFIRQLKFSLPPSNSTFRKLFSRFTSVNRIALQYDNSIHSFDEYVLGRNLVQISKSQLKIESLEVPTEIESLTPRHMDVLLKSGTLSMVKALKLYGYEFMEFSDLKFTSLFPFLQELDCSENIYWEDEWIEMLALKALNLRKINLDGNCFLTDKSLDALGNCVYLEDVSFVRCGSITLQGLSAFIHKRKNLKSLNLPFDPLYPFEDDDGILKLAETISNCKNLTHISIYEDLVRDDFLTIIAKSRSALTSLIIERRGVGGDNYTIQGVSAVLRAYKGLTKFHVCLQRDNSATYDTKMSNLVKSLPCLKDVYISSRFPFCETLFSLIQNCPLLEEIYLKSVDFDGTACYEMPGVLKKNYSVQQIHLEFLPSGFFLSNSKKMAIKSSCPALKIFDCDDCSNFRLFME